jgi:hypothetical protein
MVGERLHVAGVLHVLERVGELRILEAAAVVRLGKGKKRGLTAGAVQRSILRPRRQVYASGTARKLA